MQRITGQYEKFRGLEHFSPYPLPPHNPVLELGSETFHLYGEAMHNLGQLNEMCDRIPEIGRFIKAYVIKEALLSSEIEGIHTTFAEVFTQPITGAKPSKDLQLVKNYDKALYKMLNMIEKERLPIVSRIILAAHDTLMSHGAGNQSNPGMFRDQSVRVGNLIPAPASKVVELMDSLEKFIQTDKSLPPLIKSGLAHVQFETIHPFLDGNGRIGRMLIVLMLMNDKLLKKPIIYPSYFFKKTQYQYYQHLDAVRTQGDFEGWINYYLRAINEGAIDSWKRVKEIDEMGLNVYKIIKKNIFLRKNKEAANDIIWELFKTPWITIAQLAKTLKISFTTSSKTVKSLIDLNILEEEKELNDGKRNKLFKFKPYIDLLYKEY